MAAIPAANAWDTTPTLFDNGYFVELLAIVSKLLTVVCMVFGLFICTFILCMVAVGYDLQQQRPHPDGKEYLDQHELRRERTGQHHTRPDQYQRLPGR